jgi:transposase InsO family protein
MCGICLTTPYDPRTVSIDQYESLVRGCLPHTRGMERMTSRYVGRTIFADHASGYLGVYRQTSLNATQTVRSKHLSEREARQSDHMVQQYQGDNGVFKAEEFQNDLREHNQGIHYSGTGALHQNSAAERAVGISVEQARVMLMYAAVVH